MEGQDYSGKDYSEQHKRAWEYDAYEFWVRTAGAPSDRAHRNVENPKGMLRRYADYFEQYDGMRIANICGSCGKKAIPLALLGAEVTIFDISADNKKYAMETAQAANVHIRFEVCDILKIDMSKYKGYFDIVFMEGGILHYFHDINRFMEIMNMLLKTGGKMICSDFHPFTKIMDSLKLEQPVMSYFSTEIFEGEMAHARFYEEEARRQIPKCMYRKYTVSEILNAMLRNHFCLERFDEHPAWENEKLPGEFTAVAVKEGGKVFLICGKLCSGKTVYAQRLQREKKAVLLSVDEIMLSLFGGYAGEKHDEYAEKTQNYLFEKSLDIVAEGTDVILDWGFWTKAKRTQAKEFYRDHNIECEFRYLCIRDEVWRERVEQRNRAVLRGDTKAYFIDDNLAEKFNALFEPPAAEEIDIWVTE